MNDMNSERIRLRILVPLALAMVVLIGATVWGIYWLQRRHINEEVRSRVKGVEQLLQHELEEQVELLNGLIDFIKRDKNLQSAWLAKDRDALLGHSLPLFEDVCSKYGVTHFYFHVLDRVCFLRVHKPARWGDYIERFTLDGAVREAKPVHGIELGPLGTFTLRVVHPWRIAGELAGYIELGIGVEHITPKLKEVLGGEVLLIINKSYLNRSDWEEGREMLGQTADWDEFPNFVITGSTLQQLPPELYRYLEHLYLSSCDEPAHLSSSLKISSGNLAYQGGFAPVFDAGGRDVGDIIVMSDITEKEAVLRILIATLIIIGAVIGLALSGLLYVFLGRIENNLVSAQNDLKAEVEERKHAESSLREGEKKLNEEIHQRQKAEAKLGKQVTELRQAQEASLNMMEDAEQANRALAVEITGRKRAEKSLKKLLYDMSERIKELNCLYGVLKIVAKTDLSLDDIFRGAVDLIPPAWQYPEITCARIVVEGREFTTSNFKETEWKQLADIVVSGKKVGFVEVCYLEERPIIDEDPFLKEERSLIEALGKQMGNITNRKWAEKALEVSNRELKDFVYIASHDLREPLRKISSFGELLRDSLEGKLNRDDQENLEFMVDGANRMTEMIEGLLTYSRVNTKGISFQAVNLNEVVEQLEQLELAVLLEETGGTIEVPQPLPVVEADPIQMRQLLQNLIANGIKYRRDGVRPRIVIRAEHIDGDKVRIEVQDNGIGIKEEHYEDIFTMFRRLHPRQRYGGTGIGLAVCRKIIDRHGGRIGVESKYGEGTTLWFTLSAASEAVAVS